MVIQSKTGYAIPLITPAVDRRNPSQSGLLIVVETTDYVGHWLSLPLPADTELKKPSPPSETQQFQTSVGSQILKHIPLAQHWCKLVMDGQIGWADGQIGDAGYGEHCE